MRIGDGPTKDMSTKELEQGPLADLTAFKRDCLAIIADLDGSEKLHGLSIKDELEAEYGCEVHHGRLYPNLNDLVDLGMVKKREFDARTNTYHITARGRRELEAHTAWMMETLK